MAVRQKNELIGIPSPTGMQLAQNQHIGNHFLKLIKLYATHLGAIDAH